MVREKGSDTKELTVQSKIKSLTNESITFEPETNDDTMALKKIALSIVISISQFLYSFCIQKQQKGFLRSTKEPFFTGAKHKLCFALVQGLTSSLKA